MEKHLKAARFITGLLETNFRLGTFRFGLEPLLGLFPVVGDVLGLIFSFYIVWIAKGLGVSEKAVLKMTRNIMFDFIGGLVPILGDLFDFVFKANTKNMKILEEILEKEATNPKNKEKS